MKNFNLSDIQLTKYSFFTGKGGVGKTSIACATAVGLADLGKKILLILKSATIIQYTIKGRFMSR